MLDQPGQPLVTTGNSAPAARPGGDEKPAGPPTGREPRLRVLLVDEHGAFAPILRPLLVAQGMAVVGTTTNHEQALSATGLGMADLILVCLWVGSILDRWPATATFSWLEPLDGREQIGERGRANSPPSRRNGHADWRGIDLTGLSPRELQVLNLLVGGASNKTIARRLSLRPNTVRTHVQNIFDKLGVHSRLEAVALMIRGGHAIAAGS
jgi:DNA-binding NarL/FixJ family response regulator